MRRLSCSADTAQFDWATASFDIWFKPQALYVGDSGIEFLCHRVPTGLFSNRWRSHPILVLGFLRCRVFFSSQEGLWPDNTLVKFPNFSDPRFLCGGWPHPKGGFLRQCRGYSDHFTPQKVFKTHLPFFKDEQRVLQALHTWKGFWEQWERCCNVSWALAIRRGVNNNRQTW